MDSHAVRQNEYRIWEDVGENHTGGLALRTPNPLAFPVIVNVTSAEIPSSAVLACDGGDEFVNLSGCAN
jgi:hypothetical protein